MQTQQYQLQSQHASLRNLENHFRQLTSALNNIPLGRLPSDNQVPRQDDAKECKVVELRNGKNLPDLYKAPKAEKQNGSQGMDEESEDGWVEVQKLIPPPAVLKYAPKLPYPQKQQRSKQDQKFQEFLYTFKKQTINNITFPEAFEKMPSYAKFMMQILSKKKKLKEFEIMARNEEWHAILQRMLLPKLKDPGYLIVLCSLGSSFSSRVICDLGTSTNLMPYSIYKRLGLDK